MVKVSVATLESKKKKLMQEIIGLNVKNANAANRDVSDSLDIIIERKEAQVDKLDDQIGRRTQFRL